MLKTAILVGLIAGLLVGGLHNVVTGPVIEEAIALEEAQADGPSEPLVPLGAQRVGLVLGQGILGIIVGALFVALHSHAAKLVGTVRPYLSAGLAGAVGFWSISLLPALKYPSNPPGVGEPDTLAFRQGFQFFFLVLSVAAVLALLVALARRRWALLWALAGYVVAAVAMFVAFPSNPDPVTAPADLVREFRVLTVAGHLLLWALIAVGVPWATAPQRR